MVMADSNQDEFASIATYLSEIASFVEAQIPEGRKRFVDFERQYNEYFTGELLQANTSSETGGPSREFSHGVAELSVRVLLGVPLLLLFVGRNSAVVVELYAVLERQTLQTVPVLLSREKPEAKIISSLIERKVLAELGDALGKLNVWNEEDLQFVRKLANIRNGIVHKNAKLISKHLNGGRPLEVFEIDAVLDRVDCIPIFIRVLDLQSKLIHAARQVTWPSENHSLLGIWTSSYWTDP